MKRAVLYFRVSTFDQNCENQVPDLYRYCELRGWEKAGEFRDEAVSGGKATRPQLEKMMDEIRDGKYDILLVWSYDRFARSVSHLVQTLDYLHSIKVDFASFRERIDTTTPEGRMMFQFFAMMAEFERNRIATRTRATLARLKAQGKRLGRPKVGGEADLQRAIEMRTQGYSLRAIAHEIGLSRTWVSTHLEAASLKLPPVLDPPLPSKKI
jgi:DNA invertase Pin-like site-specific DNA recombinase